MTRPVAPQEGPRARPILFSGPMVRAILDGKKWQTRRVVKLSRDDQRASLRDPDDGYGVLIERWPKTGRAFTDFGRADRIKCPCGQPGDRLWVRESWNARYGWPVSVNHVEDRWWSEMPTGFRGLGPSLRRVIYAADQTDAMPSDDLDCLYPTDQHVEKYALPKRWVPSIHMPRWASRITLELTEVRVERVQDISEADAMAEGVSTSSLFDAEYSPGVKRLVRPNTVAAELEPGISGYRGAFAMLWDALNAKRGYGWDVNPWVWVLSFRRVDDSALRASPLDETTAEREGEA